MSPDRLQIAVSARGEAYPVPQAVEGREIPWDAVTLSVVIPAYNEINTAERLLRRVREVALGAYAHQDVPFEMLVDELQLERDMSHSPLFQVMFVFQNAPALSLELPGLSFNSLETDSAIAKFDLVLSVLESDGNLQGALEYNTDLFDAGTIRRMIRHFQRLLEEVGSPRVIVD